MPGPGAPVARPSGGLVYVSGTFRPAAEAAVSVFDHGLLYGDGVFEGIRAYNGRVFKLERHIDRLFDSAKAIRLEIPHTHAEVCDIVVEACRQNAISDGYIRLVVTRGPGDLGIDPRKCPCAELIVIARQLTMYTAASAGITLITSTFRCPDGRLTVSFSPMQNSLVQSSEWQIESGTGSYKGLRGGGWMVAKFEKRVGPGGETFTGTVTR